ncbi:MAG: DUF1801 domain-containing protein [Paracoccaceae bacterium]
MSPDDLLHKLAQTHSPALLAIAQKLRLLALNSGSDTKEEVKYGGILFAGRQGFCGVFVYSAHVTLEFGEGAALPDPDSLLLGKGKGRRHLKFADEDDAALARAGHFIALARQAADQAPDVR